MYILTLTALETQQLSCVNFAPKIMRINMYLNILRKAFKREY